jgi:hypothetical protein
MFPAPSHEPARHTVNDWGRVTNRSPRCAQCETRTLRRNLTDGLCPPCRAIRAEWERGYDDGGNAARRGEPFRDDAFHGESAAYADAWRDGWHTHQAVTVSGQVHDEAHTAETCGECQRNRAAGTMTVHYWEPIR